MLARGWPAMSRHSIHGVVHTFHVLPHSLKLRLSLSPHAQETGLDCVCAGMGLELFEDRPRYNEAYYIVRAPVKREGGKRTGPVKIQEKEKEKLRDKKKEAREKQREKKGEEG